MAEPAALQSTLRPLLRSRRRPWRLLLMGSGVVLLAAAPSPPQARAGPDADWPALLALFAQRGLRVVIDHPRCREPGLFGLYERNRRQIIVCARGDRRDTLLHEGWHGIQSVCLRGAPLLPEAILNQGLIRSDRRDLERLYGPGRWAREAEARIMARLPLAAYRQWVVAACGPADAGEPDQPSSGGSG